MANLNEITTKINNSEGSIGQLINNDTLYNNIEDVTYSLNRLVEDLRLNPKRYVHFSALNLGKTVYVDENSSDAKGKKEKVIYKIQIHQSNKSIALAPDNFKGYKNVEEAMVGGIYIYVVGQKKNIETARQYLKEIQVDYPEAKIVEIMEGKYTIVN
jgi:phospholipid/cholesterol/gamma-HCH transport system substrate-binding protein